MLPIAFSPYLLASFLGLGLFLWFWVVKTEVNKLKLCLLFFLALGIRLYMIQIDPFLQDWDERFHALVARNMIEQPFTPLLHKTALLPYDPAAWCCNHIWLHKQPLFLWQMALSMKVFGVSVWAMRLPSALMGAIAVLLSYDFMRIWSQKKKWAFLVALFSCFSFVQLELSSGRLNLDQNDVSFAFYVGASFWAFSRYSISQKKWPWAIAIGLFAGAGVLVKWLTGILVFGSWGLYILGQKEKRFQLKYWGHIALGAASCLATFGPWQVYIIKRFPLESSLSYAFNREHIFTALEGHSGNFLFHFRELWTIYGSSFHLIFLALGILLSLIISPKKAFGFGLFAAFGVLYLFFSLVKTKMPAFCFPVHFLGLSYIVWGLAGSLQYVKFPALRKWGLAILGAILCFGIFQPQKILQARQIDNHLRNAKLHNTAIYKSMGTELQEVDVVFNCKPFEQTELMFFQDVAAYHWYPEEAKIDSLLQLGYRIAAFKSHHDQHLPAYFYREEIKIIDVDIH
ncbi:glycosyltransferase family 39 protein [Saprospira sp. CCB-QB6]|uniref:ArnT family glycosyltransferase n=1 Tax=Saprospira sp. CCB-QB6 TaxID=3023936 RepID=UPI00234A6D88|nr:glycosyltransferase family 39 protein [Saprospira sp. CCB-QB6]WCL82994.1 glycosyltransferase family 39 protein [Saprospira sp. CCB-QB6]